MLARTLHIDDTYFTYLPNPTPDRWNSSSVSLVNIMESYRALSVVQLPGVTRKDAIRAQVARHVDVILGHQADHGVERLLFLKALHAALDDADEVLTARVKAETHAPVDGCGEATELQLRRRVVRDVLRSHIQEVLRLLNEREDRAFDTQSLLVTGVRPVSISGLRQSFEEINEASPEDRQQKFMQVYFEVIRPHVVRHAAESTSRRAGSVREADRHRRASFPSAPLGYGLRARGGTGATQNSVAVRTDPGTDTSASIDPVPATAASSGCDGAPPRKGPTTQATRADGGDAGHEGEETDQREPRRGRRGWLASQAASHDDIWRVLVFRMICWLMLHDFNSDDVQVSKSELLGSRMPVYIA